MDSVVVFLQSVDIYTACHPDHSVGISLRVTSVDVGTPRTNTEKEKVGHCAAAGAAAAPNHPSSGGGGASATPLSNAGSTSSGSATAAVPTGEGEPREGEDEGNWVDVKDLGAVPWVFSAYRRVAPDASNVTLKKRQGQQGSSPDGSIASAAGVHTIPWHAHHRLCFSMPASSDSLRFTGESPPRVRVEVRLRVSSATIAVGHAHVSHRETSKVSAQGSEATISRQPACSAPHRVDVSAAGVVG
jgi:hypothetical protein